MNNTPSRSKRAPKTQAERSDSTQRRIVESAMKLIYKEGFQKANLQNIAQGAKVTLGALQHHFGNRQALMERVVNDVMAPLGDHGAVWPDASLPLDQRAREFVQKAWENIYGPPSYVAAWALFFGCKATVALFKRIDARRAADDPIFFARFLELFPEIGKHHKHPEAFAAMVFATLRGIAVFKLFSVSAESVEQQLACLADLISMSGAPATSRNEPSAARGRSTHAVRGA
ncbi:MAG: TetR/AcrR family transcriptional regulator [Betaproteobacteria bacterium]